MKKENLFYGLNIFCRKRLKYLPFNKLLAFWKLVRCNNFFFTGFNIIIGISDVSDLILLIQRNKLKENWQAEMTIIWMILKEFFSYKSDERLQMLEIFKDKQDNICVKTKIMYRSIWISSQLWFFIQIIKIMESSDSFELV